MWTPKVIISNAIGDVKVNTSCAAQFDKTGRALVLESKKFSGQFYESMELYDFPFDKLVCFVTFVFFIFFLVL